MMFLTHPVSFFFSINFLNIGFSCTSWSHARNVLPVGYALTAHRWPGKWQHSQPCLSLREKHVKYIRKAEFLSSNEQHLREYCMPQILTLFFNVFFFFLEYQLPTWFWRVGRAWIRSKIWTKWHGQDFLPLYISLYVSGKCVIPTSCLPLSLKEQTLSNINEK